MTVAELQALVTILNRAPMTPGEGIFVQGLMSRELARAQADAQALAETQVQTTKAGESK